MFGTSPQLGRINKSRRAEKNAHVITLNKCKEVLKINGLTLEENRIKELREYLYFLAGLQLEDEAAKEGLIPCVR